MKVIVINKIKKGSYVAFVQGFKNAQVFASDEVTALKYLTSMLEEKNPSWIQRSDFNNNEKEL